MTILPEPPAAGNGAILRDAALSLLTATRPATIRRLQRAAVRLALERGTITADDLRDAVPIPPGIHPTVTGAAIRGLAMLRILRGGDYIQSRRPLAHARPVRIWHLADAAAAGRWLNANAEFPEPTTT